LAPAQLAGELKILLAQALGHVVNEALRQFRLSHHQMAAPQAQRNRQSRVRGA
jgi:hypothetical protein